MDVYDNDVFVNLVNRNNNSKRDSDREQRINQCLKKCEDAADKSIEKEDVRYYARKKRNTNVIKERIIAIVLTATLVAGVTAKVTTDIIDNGNVVISETAEIKNYIDDRIDYYEDLMNMYSEDENKIEISHGRNSANNDVLVSYNEDNLAKHIYDASLVSESEARCVVIAAYRLINGPYKESVLRKAFSILKSNYEFDNNMKLVFGNGFDSFLEQLGYTELKDYNDNERDNIKELKTVEEYMINRSGR